VFAVAVVDAFVDATLIALELAAAFAFVVADAVAAVFVFEE